MRSTFAGTESIASIRRRARVGIVVTAVCFATAVVANGQTTLVGGGTPLTKPAKVDSFIVSSDGKFLWDGATTYTGLDLTAAMKAFPGQSVDTVMTQCFAGGFANGIGASGLVNYTYTGACNWNELSWGNAFTTSWVQSFPRHEGLYLHYTDATNGDAAIAGPPAYPAVTADAYGPSGILTSIANRKFENPVYASPDALKGGNPDPNANNNVRDVYTNNEFAVLLAPDTLTDGADTPRYQTNIDSVYKSLINIGFPANQIIVLYGSNAANTRTTGGTPINGPATAANITNALKTGAGLYGNITGQTAPAAPIATNALFTYYTGHGGSWDKRGATGKATQQVNPGTAPANQVDVTVTDLPVNAFVDADDTGDTSGTVDLQVASSATDLAGTLVSLDGSTLGSLQPDADPQTDLTGIIGTSNYYDVSVSLPELNSMTDSPLDITLNNTTDPDTYDGLISAVTFNDNGESWSVGVAVPEPASLGLLVIGSFILIPRNRRRGVSPCK